MSPLTAETTSAPPALQGGVRTWITRELNFPRMIRLAAVTIQFALLIVVIRMLNIETKAFENVLTLAFGGFLVHHFLPSSWRLPFFALLSVASVLLAFGLEHGGWMLGLGGLLIALCHIPAAISIRILLILAVAACLALFRIGPEWLPDPLRSALPGTIWPILGAMFMFRLIGYMYDLKHRTAPFSAWRACGYFFMIPNVCFPLFPVVDYQTFCRNHYNDDAIRIYQIGVKWILRGLVQLLIYRLIYMYYVIKPGDAVTALDAGQYMLTTFLLYFKISGLFHLIIGMLHMFGFNMPETHHLYLLSSSFTDFWRRINIYWKDFIMKVVFYPLYFRWKKWKLLGEGRAMALATLSAFVATWLLHSYQWFWIRGTFPIEWSDMVFWLGLGIVVLINIQWEQRRGRQRALKRAKRTLRSEVGLALRTAGTFTAICILWTIWSTPDVDELRFLAEAAANITIGQAGVILAVPLGMGLAGVALGRRSREHTEGKRSTSGSQRDGFWRSAAWTSTGAILLIAVALRPEVLLSLPVPSAWSQVGFQFMGDLRTDQLNRADEEAMQRGYYEDLGDVTRFNNELWQLYGQRPVGWGDLTGLQRDRDDVLLYEYTPLVETTYRGAPFVTNSRGMQDREYTEEKAAGTFRMALVGSSHDAGSGVPPDETYENLVESMLNDRWGSDERRYEILNFSVGGFGPLQKLAKVEREVLQFEPDVVLYAASSTEVLWATERGAHELLERGLVREFPLLVDVFRKAGVDPDERGIRPRVLEHRLRPFRSMALEGVFTQFGESTRRGGARPIVLLVEHPYNAQRPPSFDVMIEMGRRCNVEVIDLYGAFADVKDRSSLGVAPWDTHTNSRGHALLANLLFEKLVEQSIVPTDGLTEPGPAGDRLQTEEIDE